MNDDLMTAPELAKYLKVELRTVYRYLKDAQLPAIRMGGRWRFRKEDIDRWLVEHAPLRAQRRHQPRILLVDDDETFRELLSDFFQTKDCTFRGAENGEAALALLKEMTFDLLIVDLRMPGMGGIELIRRAKSLHPDVRILVLTAYSGKESAIEALRLGVTDYLEKPIRDLQALASAVEVALRP
ncbi:MAG: response regulator [Candidatus Methylomirabilis oxyfera]|nr:response regulator [Candidatus Methylomirabilis oxyfera]